MEDKRRFPVLDKGYRNAVINARWTGESWAYRVTFPTGQSFEDQGFDDLETAFRAAREFINKARLDTGV